MNNSKALFIYSEQSFVGSAKVLNAPFFDWIKSQFDCTFCDISCDLKQEIETHHPEIIIYYGLRENYDYIPWTAPSNKSCYPEILRIGINARDKHSPLWIPCENLLRDLGCEYVFSNVFSHSERPLDCPQSSGFFFLPIDHNIFYDRKSTRDIPLGMIGAGFCKGNAYPWRRDVYDTFIDRAPIFLSPRPHATISTLSSIHNIVGDEYAKLLGRCQVAFSCGGYSQMFVNKMLEIPACGSTLICEDSPIMQQMGFKDMENCVFIDKQNAVEKLDYLFSTTGLLNKISQAGFKLVHDNYTLAKPGIFQHYLSLHKSLKENEIITQPNPFGPLQISDKNNPPSFFEREEPLQEGYTRGFQNLLEDDLKGAEREFSEVLKRISYHSMGRLGMSIVFFQKGNPNDAIRILEQVFYHVKVQGGIIGFNDPVICAYYALYCLALNKPTRLNELIDQASLTRNPALVAANAFINFFNSNCKSFDISENQSETNISSNYPLNHSVREWVAIFSKYLIPYADDELKQKLRSIFNMSLDTSKNNTKGEANE